MTFQLIKTSSNPAVSDRLNANNVGTLMTDTVHKALLEDIRVKFQDSGIPIETLQPMAPNYKDQFSLQLKKQSDLLSFCDSYHMAKMLLKMSCMQIGEYDIELAPVMGGVSNHVNLELDTPRFEDLQSL